MTDENENVPAVKESTLPAPTMQFSHAPEGLEDVPATDLGPGAPILKIVHAVRSRTDIGHPGQYRLGDQVYDKLDVVFLRIHKFRELTFGKGKEAKTVCMSQDGHHPHEMVLNKRSMNCGGCEYAQWTDGANGKRVPPDCKEGYAMYGLLLNGQMDQPQFFLYLARRTAYRSALALAKGFKEAGGPIFGWRIEMTTEEQSNEGVVWYTPLFVQDGRINAEEYRRVYESLRGVYYLPRYDGDAEKAPWDDPDDARGGLGGDL